MIALDVAYGELALTLRDDARVTVLERINARALAPGALPYPPDLVVADVSFISLAKVLPAVLACTAGRFDALVMVKPQFEVGPRPDRQGRRGARPRAAARGDRRGGGRGARGGGGGARLRVLGLPGPAGNRETFAWLAERGRAGAVEDLEAAAREVEP